MRKPRLPKIVLSTKISKQSSIGILLITLGLLLSACDSTSNSGVAAAFKPLLAGNQSAASNTTISFNDNSFSVLWNRVDKPVRDLPNIGRGFSWGLPIAGSASLTSEAYNNTNRTVQYFDKARMEINDPQANPGDLYYVSTGLLTAEMVSGRRQDGDNSFTQLSPSTVQVAGDPNDGGANAVAPTYASFKKVATLVGNENGQFNAVGKPIASQVDKSGNVSNLSTPPENRTLKAYDKITQHNIADVFVDFGNQRGPVWDKNIYTQDSVFFGNPTYVLGRPITEPYWTHGVVGGVEKDILVQLFERRTLTYTPANPSNSKVEMGNVGQHYYKWRYILNNNSPLPATSGVSDARFARLTHGVDLTLWFYDPEPQPPDYYQSYITATDLQLIKKLGFRHVRLSIAPSLLFQENNPQVLNTAMLPYVDKAIDLILANDLAVIVDMHFEEEITKLKTQIVNDATYTDKFAIFWKSLAQHLSTRDPEKLFLEVLNEPSAANEQVWYKDQEKLLAAIRQGAPQHTLIAESNNRIGDEIIEPDALMQMTPLKDPNIVYNFHFYEPGIFTDQGSDNIEGMANVKGLPYPYDANVCQKLIANAKDTQAREKTQDYCGEQWDSSKIEAKLKKAAEWGRKYNVRLTVNEFGALYGGATEDARVRWFTDVRTNMEKYNIGWNVWGYDDAYGIRHEENGNFLLDTDIVKALGLG